MQLALWDSLEKDSVTSQSLTAVSARRPTRKLNQEKVLEVEKTYIESSVERPEKRFRGKRLMKASLRGTYRKYKKAKDNPVSWSVFRKMKPENVCKLTKTHYFMCQCVYCINVQMKLD